MDEVERVHGYTGGGGTDSGFCGRILFVGFNGYGAARGSFWCGNVVPCHQRAVRV